ncbi:hypothetical protein MMC25_004539 [Agyrium rufum]|nr:hypothetical protein [Agyrium rufum]
MGGFTESQDRALVVTERVASVFSLLGCSFVFATFLLSSNFRRPINRLVFYATWGNCLCNIATLISQAGIHAGQNSVLCQFQGFFIQMFLPADAMWNLALAFNVYLTVFRKYNQAQLKALEWRYLLACYGGPFTVAFIYCFIDDKGGKGKIYGSAVVWCWISIDWDFLRVALCYGPAWACIFTILTIYIMAGREIFARRRQLRSFKQYKPSDPVIIENPFTSFKTTEIHITSELATLPHANHSQTSLANAFDHPTAPTVNENKAGYKQYTVTIERGPLSPMIQLPRTPAAQNIQARNRNAAMDANVAAWSYLKCAFLFFVSLLITWTPSSINRVNSLVHPEAMSFPLNYATGLVLPLMGFWNSVIYITTSWPAVKALFRNLLGSGRGSLKMVSGGSSQRHHHHAGSMGRPRTLDSMDTLGKYHPRHQRNSLSDSMKGLADVV